MQSIGVVGAGTMGLDIARTFAASGFSVLVRDISADILERASARLKQSLEKAVSKGKLSGEAAEAIQGRLRFTTALADFQTADLVVEAVLEDAKLKKALFQELDGICKAEAIFATNTSSLSITELAASVGRRDRFIGMHFFNPVPSMALVEVVRGLDTSDETAAAVRSLAVALGKEPVEVRDAPGFVVNKILIPMVNEAVVVLQEGVASAGDIDKAMRLGANQPMGPLALADLIGNDVVLHILDRLFAETGDPRYRAATRLRAMVRGGLLGRKTGRGFFSYQ